MMQLEPNPHSPLLSASSSSSSSGDRGALPLLTDTEMLRFGEFLDGYPAAAFLNRSLDRSAAASADEHSSGRLQRRRGYQHQERQQESSEQGELQPDTAHRELVVGRKCSSASSSSDTSEAVDTDAAWTSCSAAPTGEVTIAASYDAGYAHFVGEYAHEAAPRDAPTYFEVSCWPGDDCAAAGADADCLSQLPIYSDAVARRIPSDLLTPCEKDVDLCSPSPNTPSPAHMEHFMPFVHHGEPEMIFAGMELGGADFQSFPFSHQLHYLQYQQHQVASGEPQHGHFWFPPGADGCHAAEPFAPPMQPLMLPLGAVGEPRNAVQFDDPAFGSATHVREHCAGAGSWSSAAADGSLPPTHFIKSDSRASPLASEPPGLNAAAAARRPLESSRARRSAAATSITAGASVPTALESNFGGLPGVAVHLELVTLLNDCYWKNGRKNLQCFPVCPEHNDFYSMKMNNRKHSSVGVCRGPVYCHVVSDAADDLNSSAAGTTSDSGRPPFPLVLKRPAGVLPQPQHMKYEFGVGASGSGGGTRELFVLGRFERVPQRDESDLAGQLSAPPAFSSSAAFEQFRYSCFQAAELEDRRMQPDAAGRVRSTWCFLPDVWKVQPTLKKKRKATRSAPAQTFPFCFRVFVYVWNDGGYACAAARASSFFELYSTRTVDRVKRKRSAKGIGSDDRSLKRAATASMKMRV